MNEMIKLAQHVCGYSRQQAAWIYDNVITYHRNQIRRYCELARLTPSCRVHMLNRARAEAGEIKDVLRTWRA